MCRLRWLPTLVLERSEVTRVLVALRVEIPDFDASHDYRGDGRCIYWNDWDFALCDSSAKASVSSYARHNQACLQWQSSVIYEMKMRG